MVENAHFPGVKRASKVLRCIYSTRAFQWRGLNKLSMLVAWEHLGPPNSDKLPLPFPILNHATVISPNVYAVHVESRSDFQFDKDKLRKNKMSR
jgi:hypothetical protein